MYVHHGRRQAIGVHVPGRSSGKALGAGAGSGSGVGLVGVVDLPFGSPSEIRIGSLGELGWYSWDWNELAKSVGLTGSDKGHIAQEVQKVRPDLVVEKNGYLAVIYGGF